MQAGYTGKLPAYGDFVEGGGSLRARQEWSAWAEHGLSVARQQTGDGFPDMFLTSPIWRFAVADGVFGDSAAAGVFCPSMDKVGRLFPFAAIAELPSGVAPLAAMTALDSWFRRLETLVLNALDPAATLEVLTAAMADPPEMRGGEARGAINGDGHVSPLSLDGEGKPAVDADLSLDLDLDLGGDGPEPAADDGIWITLGGVEAPARGYSQTGAADDTLFSVLITGETARGA